MLALVFTLLWVVPSPEMTYSGTTLGVKVRDGWEPHSLLLSYFAGHGGEHLEFQLPGIAEARKAPGIRTGQTVRTESERSWSLTALAPA